MSSQERYCRRLELAGPLPPTLETLARLQDQHMQRVPFENLSVGLGEIIQLDEAWLFHKIVDSGRGGFCFELNGLYAWLLRTLGFDVTYLSAGVWDEGDFGPPYDHLTLQVTIDGQRYLTDVGFGRSFRHPLRLDTTEAQHDGFAAYRVVPAGAQRILETQNDAAAWTPQYRFTLRPETLADFAGMCRYHQTSPNSSFTRRTICTRATATGRVTLANNQFIQTEPGRRTETTIPTASAYRELMQHWFNITLTHLPAPLREYFPD